VSIGWLFGDMCAGVVLSCFRAVSVCTVRRVLCCAFVSSFACVFHNGVHGVFLFLLFLFLLPTSVFER